MPPTFTTPARPLTWLITGCSSGFGLALARVAQAGGHTVIATSREPGRTPELVAEVEGRGGRWLRLDVAAGGGEGDDADPELAAALARADVLVNNAGAAVFAPVETATDAELRAHLDTMYLGPLRLVRAVLPHMRRRRFGVVVNISSGASLDGREAMGAYAGAKAALDGITRVLAKEVAPFNIRTLTVVLGMFNTNMARATGVGAAPLPADYAGSVVERMVEFAAARGSAAIPGPPPAAGDKDKAMRAVYEVVLGRGSAGAGRGDETLLLLGADMTARAEGVRAYLGRALEAFKDVTGNVGVDP
ncbi:putative short-chain oxidoreductase [Durotheca rogersii]|uniref:putative short-chain oxidoreductase n=1 Tax=Durotheca rogersii TaxID=419775 RepID=UPI00221E83EB|nr:putative short-chain oxidoreductase [Durotheca rogersii]KAI5861576.1 putative short-chain oxidoreductase [Durotheca rogersii]